jgi:hypothetical protein
VIGLAAGTTSSTGPAGVSPDRLVQRDLAVLDQHHRRRGDDRLGQRGDAEDRLPGHRGTALGIREAGGLHLDPAVAGHQAHRSRHRSAADVPFQDVTQIAHQSLSACVRSEGRPPPRPIIIGRAAAAGLNGHTHRRWQLERRFSDAARQTAM